MPGGDTARLHFALREQALLDEQGQEPFEPDFVVARSEIVRWRDAFPGVPGHVEVPASEKAASEGEGEDAPLPLDVEHRLVRLRPHRPEAVHAAEIVAPVHRFRPSAGARASPTPIIESRVTSAASSSSLMPSVPEGRRGTTM